jgi:hypothetical protein
LKTGEGSAIAIGEMQQMRGLQNRKRGGQSRTAYTSITFKLLALSDGGMHLKCALLAGS